MFSKYKLLLLTLTCFSLAAQDLPLVEYPTLVLDDSTESQVPVPFTKGFTFGAEFLYWKPCITEVDFAAETIVEDESRRISVWYKDLDIEWTPGIRLSFFTPCFLGNIALEAHYSYLTRTTRRDVDAALGELLSPLLHVGFFDFSTPQPGPFHHAQAHHDFKFHAWDFLFSYQTKGSCLDILYYAGPTGFFFDQHLRTTLEEAASEDPMTVRFDWANDLWAVGGKLGSRIKYCICESYIAFAEWDVSLLAGANFSSAQDLKDNLDQQWSTLEPHSCFLIPGFDLKIGFENEFTLSRQIFKWRFGYEMQNFWNTPTRRAFYSRGRYLLLTQSNPPNIGSFGFHGLFAGLYATF